MNGVLNILIDNSVEQIVTILKLKDMIVNHLDPQTLSENDEWALLSPQERFIESSKLWAVYLSWGGSLDPEPDSQSPFDCEELERAIPFNGRSGVHIIRRGGV